MRSEELYEGLKDLAQKLNIAISEQSFRRSGVRAKSGLCIVKGEPVFIIDKHIGTSEKIDVLASYLSRMPTEDMYIVPAIRELLHQYGKNAIGENQSPDFLNFKKFT